MKPSPFTKRLKDAREEAKLSQAELGEKAGIDADVASARMNQYERGKHTPAYPTLVQIAKILNVPVGYFFTEDENFASFIKQSHRLSSKKKRELYQHVNNLDNS